jgi:hypothetical protein
MEFPEKNVHYEVRLERQEDGSYEPVISENWTGAKARYAGKVKSLAEEIKKDLAHVGLCSVVVRIEANALKKN